MTKLLLVGGGNMGAALLAGWRQKSTNGFMADMAIKVIEPYPSDTLKSLCHADDIYPDAAAVEGVFDIIVLAVKPQSFPDLLPQLKPFLKQDTMILSIAAGKTMSGMAALLGDDTAIIRVMPNTPALIGEGMSVLVANARATNTQKSCAEALLQAVGKTLWVQDEESMHAVTALSGSGPAYVFALIESMHKAGTALGLPDDIALQLARQTVFGAAKLASERMDTHPAELRRQVTSPKGTTEAALEELIGDNQLDNLMKNALEAAAQRSRELV